MATIFSNGINATVAILTELGETYGVSTLPELERAIIADQKERIKAKRVANRLAQKNAEVDALDATANADVESITQTNIAIS